MRVLLVEDDRKAAGRLRRGLEEEGYVVDVAHTGDDGERHAETVDYDLIALDRLLPAKAGGAPAADPRRERGAPRWPRQGAPRRPKLAM